MNNKRYTRLEVKSADSEHPLALLSWNIQVGRSSGLFENGWNRRKSSLIAEIQRLSPDVICLQEPVWEQLTFIELSLKHYSHAGRARDDGQKKGEFCPILVDKRKFVITNTDTFWLSDTPERSGHYWDFPFQRICTWAHIKELESDNSFYVFNSHFPLNVGAHEKSAQLIAAMKNSIAGSASCFITADFNCDPNLFPATAFVQVGMKNCARTFGNEKDFTMTLLGKPMACIDAVFVSNDVKVTSFEIAGTRCQPKASDHLGIFLRCAMAR